MKQILLDGTFIECNHRGDEQILLDMIAPERPSPTLDICFCTKCELIFLDVVGLSLVDLPEAEPGVRQ